MLYPTSGGNTEDLTSFYQHLYASQIFAELSFVVRLVMVNESGSLCRNFLLLHILIGFNN